ncbi:hypothetical protein [Oceanicoccus sp. KOV_DT_Chl]|uniref:hypothetical protein n=1 Tax=Oceanicoccus sp. KOV_DT_Chl TaxID=1904639 RepID=UPI000C7C4C76|nr:hypothetical protein [Oceanicoccus sp. KOV_DT_Chl]
MESDKTIDQALELIEKREKSLSSQRKAAYFLLAFSLIYACIFIYSFAKIDDFTSMSEDLNKMASTESEKAILQIVDTKILIAFSQHDIESSMMPVIIGIMFGSGIGILLSSKSKKHENKVLKHVVQLISKDS